MSTVDQERRARDEVEVAADTVAALIVAGIVPIGKVQLAAEAVGLMAGEVHTAVRRRNTLGWIPPRHAPTANDLQPEQVSPSPQVEPQPEPKSPGPRRFTNGSRATGRYKRAYAGCADGEKRCPRCGKPKPLDDFAIKDARTGSRKSMCRDCMKDYQGERYVKVGYKAVLVEVADGDVCVGHACPECGEPFEVGQTVAGERIVHASCQQDHELEEAE